MRGQIASGASISIDQMQLIPEPSTYALGFGIAPTAKAARVLSAELSMEADTVAKLVADPLSFTGAAAAQVDAVSARAAALASAHPAAAGARRGRGGSAQPLRGGADGRAGPACSPDGRRRGSRPPLPDKIPGCW